VPPKMPKMRPRNLPVRFHRIRYYCWARRAAVSPHDGAVLGSPAMALMTVGTGTLLLDRDPIGPAR
jgi:hypothetical protein